MFYKKAVLKNFAIVSCSIKLQAFRPANVKKRPQYRCFPVNIAKFSRAPILKNTCERLFLYIKLNICIQETKFACHEQHLFGHLSSRNAQKTHKGQSIPDVFLLCLERNHSQTFKSGSFAKLFL